MRNQKAKSETADLEADEPIERRHAQPLPQSLQENVLTALCWRNKSGEHVLNMVDLNLFESDYKVIAEQVIPYRRKYGKPPRAHTADLVADILEDKNNPRAKTYRRILLCMEELKDKLNLQFVKDQTHAFIQEQKRKIAVMRSAEILDAGGAGALEKVDDIWRKQLDGAPLSTARVLTTRTADQFETIPVKWLWEPFIPLGMLTTFVGDGDVGKSTVGIDIAARCTKGLALPQIGGEPRKTAPKGSVLFFCQENDIPRIIKPRLEAAGADLSRIYFPGYEEPDDPSQFDPIERLDTMAREIEAIVKEKGDITYAQIDPITDYVGKIDMYRDDQVRALLRPIVRIAAKYNLAVVSILHQNKKTDAPTRYRGMGSVAFRNVSQSTVIIAKSQEQSGLRLMMQEKGNLIADEKHNCVAGFHLASVGAYAKVKWETDWQEVDPDEILADKSPTKQAKAISLLRQWLADGPVAVKELQRLARENGISNATLQIAKDGLHVTSDKHGKGKWFWSLRK